MPYLGVHKTIVLYLETDAVKPGFSQHFHPYNADLAQHRQRWVAPVRMVGRHKERALSGLTGHKLRICNAIESIAAEILRDGLHLLGGAW